MIRSVYYTPEIGGMGRRPGRPAVEEAADERRRVIRNGERIDEDLLARRAVDRIVRRRVRRDPGDEAELRAGKVRHAGGAVVDHGEPSCRRVEVPQRRKRSEEHTSELQSRL